jgi:hypothetical protein
MVEVEPRPVRVLGRFASSESLASLLQVLIFFIFFCQQGRGGRKEASDPSWDWEIEKNQARGRRRGMGSYAYKYCMCFTRKFRSPDAQPPPDVRAAHHSISASDDGLRRFLSEVQAESPADVQRILAMLTTPGGIARLVTRSSAPSPPTLDDFFGFLFSPDLNPPIGNQVLTHLCCLLNLGNALIPLHPRLVTTFYFQRLQSCYCCILYLASMRSILLFQGQLPTIGGEGRGQWNEMGRTAACLHPLSVTLLLSRPALLGQNYCKLFCPHNTNRVIKIA